MTDFIEIKEDGEGVVAAKWPAAETVVEVRLKDGTVRLAWFDCNIMETGDWDFVPVEDEFGDHTIDGDSIAHDVVAWRPIVRETA